MKPLLIGVPVAAIATYFFGFLYWGGPNPMPYLSWKTPADVVAAGQALKEHFPENGTYHIPGILHDTERLDGLYAAGPVAFVHMTNVDGRPMMSASIMVQGFVLYLAAALLVGLLLKVIAPAIHCPRSCLLVSLLFAAAAVVFIDLGDAVWWETPLSWKIHVAAYNAIGIFLMSFILSMLMLWFSRRRATVAAE